MLHTNWHLAHFTTLLYFVSILHRLFVGLAFSGPRMYAEIGDITLASVIIHVPVAAVN